MLDNHDAKKIQEILQSELGDIKKTQQTMQSGLKTMQSEFGVMQSEFKVMQSELKDIRKSQETFQSDLKSIKTDIAKIRTDTSTIVNSFGREVITLRQRVERIEEILNLPPLADSVA